MATKAVDRIFVDTNILTRATIVTAPLHEKARAALEKLWKDGAELWISRQVVREYVANVARELAQIDTPPANEEARLRAAISRAYYAAFNQARQYIEEVFYTKASADEGKSHLFVITWFDTYPDEAFQRIGDHLDNLRGRRRRADYDATFSNLARETRYSISLAATVLELLKTLPR